MEFLHSKDFVSTWTCSHVRAESASVSVHPVEEWSDLAEAVTVSWGRGRAHPDLALLCLTD